MKPRVRSRFREAIGLVAIPTRKDSRGSTARTKDGNIIRSQQKVTGRIKEHSAERANVQPAPKQGESFRVEWDTPMMISPNAPGNVSCREQSIVRTKRGDDSWAMISPDWTTPTRSLATPSSPWAVKGSEISLSRTTACPIYPGDPHARENRRKQPGGGVCTYTGSATACSRVREAAKVLAEHHENMTGFRPARGSAEWFRSAYEAGHGVRNRRTITVSTTTRRTSGRHDFARRSTRS